MEKKRLCKMINDKQIGRHRDGQVQSEQLDGEKTN